MVLVIDMDIGYVVVNTISTSNYNFPNSGKSGGAVFLTSPDSQNPARSETIFWAFFTKKSQIAKGGPNLGSGGICGLLSGGGVLLAAPLPSY